VAADEDLSGRTLANIQLIKKLGQGGMGAVYQGRDLILKRPVAVKSLLLKQQVSQSAKERFRREALLLSQLDHANVCRIYSLIETEETDFLVLEYIQGSMLNPDDFKSHSKTKQIDIIIQILSGLQAAHRKNIIHRDIKPENIMINKQGVVKLLDFGISRLSEARQVDDGDRMTSKQVGQQTHIGAVVGTLNYMSPEQAAGEELTTATDMYSFGLLLQCLLSDVPAYPKTTTAEQLLKLSHQGDTLNPTDIPRHWQKLIQSLKAFAPAERPTAKDAFAQVYAIKAKPLNRLRLVGVAVVFLLVSLAVGKYITDLKHERTQAQLAQQKAEQVVAFLSDMFQQANPYAPEGKDVTAVNILNQAVTRIETELTEQVDTRTYLLSIMAESLRQLGQVNRAKDLLQQAMASIDHNTDISQPTKNHVQQSMADFWLETGDYHQAEKIYRQLLLKPQEHSPAEEIQLKSKLVLALSNLGHCDQAVEIAQSNILQTAKNDLYRGHNLNALGMCHYFTGNYQKSIEYYQQTLDLIEHSQTEFGGLRLSVLDNLATSYSETGDLDKTLALMKQVVSSEEQLLGEHHIDLVAGYDNMAATYFKMGDIDAALAWNQKALDIHDYNIDNALVDEAQMLVSKAWTLSSRSVFYQYQKDYQRAEEISHQVLAMSLASLPENHLNVADAYYNLGKNQWFNQKPSQAISHADKAMAIYHTINQPLVRKHLSNHELKIVIYKDDAPVLAAEELAILMKELNQEGDREETIAHFKDKYKQLLEE
jgi:Serine/threonine protein kinase